jgi:hypothetical protein
MAGCGVLADDPAHRDPAGNLLGSTGLPFGRLVAAEHMSDRAT